MGGDSFYVRAHFNYTSKNPNELSFKINDILHVTDTLYNGVIGQWVATKLDNSSQNNDNFRGTIPNQETGEKLVLNAETIDQQTQSSNSVQNTNTFGAISLGASARMSLRKKLGKNVLTKRSKSASRSNANSDTESNLLFILNMLINKYN